MLRRLIHRLIVGLPALLPAYLMNLAVVWFLNDIYHFSPVGIITSVVVGDVIAYIGNVAMTPYLLIYFKKTGYYTQKELEPSLQHKDKTPSELTDESKESDHPHS